MYIRHKVVLSGVTAQVGGNEIEMSGITITPSTHYMIYLKDVILYSGCSAYHPHFISTGTTASADVPGAAIANGVPIWKHFTPPSVMIVAAGAPVTWTTGASYVVVVADE